MSYSAYLIKNCGAKDAEVACPKLWSELKPSFSDLVRHCDYCNKKVYLCETDEQIKFYSSVKFCIAVAGQEGVRNVERNPPTSSTPTSNAIAPKAQHDNTVKAIINRPVPNVWRRPPLQEQCADIQPADNLAQNRKQQGTVDHGIPAFLRKK